MLKNVSTNVYYDLIRATCKLLELEFAHVNYITHINIHYLFM